MNEPVLSCFIKQAKPCKQIEQRKWYTMTKPVILAFWPLERLLGYCLFQKPAKRMP